MNIPLRRLNVRRLAGTTTLVVVSALLAWRLFMPKAGLEARGAAVWLELGFLIILYIFINLTGFGLGRLIFRYVKLPSLTQFEMTLAGYLLGLGVLSLGIMVLGFAGWLNGWAIFLWLFLSGAVATRELIGLNVGDLAIRFPKIKNLFLILLQLTALVAVPMLLVECLSPVWDYDALLYHLEGPRQFLLQGRIAFDPEVLRSAYPYLGEMPFAVGIVFDLIPLAKLINFTYAILFVLSSYVFSRRFFGRQSAYTTVGILIGAPAFWVWGTWAGVDFAWATYEFWSIYAILLWLAGKKEHTKKWLAFAGVMSGFAISVKYLSLPALLVVMILIAWKSFENTKRPVRDVLINLTIFAFCTAIVGGAWYIRNWIVTGNPVYPLVFGGPGWEPVEAQVLNDYVGSFGVGKQWLDYLLLPYNVYAFHNKFSTIGIEWIHPAVWLAFFFPFIAKSHRRHTVLFVYACLGFILWAATSQVIRFLIPVTAFLAILAGAVIESFPLILKRLLQIGLIGGFMLFNLVFQLQWLQDKDAWEYVSGHRSTAEFLQNMSYGYEAIQYIQEYLDVDQKVQFLWDGRGYLCDTRCVPDDEQSGAIRLTFEDPLPSDLAFDLREAGGTHLMLSQPDATWFILYHDPQWMHRDALNYFESVFFPACGKLVYSDEDMRLYEITCQQQSDSRTTLELGNLQHGD